MSKHRFQIVVVGSGFAGSLIAMIARRLGFATALLERGRHPRFAIGESSTPLANLLLEEIARDYDLPRVRPLCKWGTWQDQCPQIACGLKRGFTFYYHALGKPFAPDPQRLRQLLVGANPHETVADTHWYRPDLDHYLARQAEQLGVDWWEETVLNSAREEGEVMRLTGTRHDENVEIIADFVIDATGPRGFLHQTLRLPESGFDGYPTTQALYSHFQNVGVLPEVFCANGGRLPYPPEQAAVHHMFPGGWVWVLKFNNGIASAGVAATDRVANAFRFHEGQPAWSRLLEQLPSLNEVFKSARVVVPFVYSDRLAFRSACVTGRRWALLPSAAGFVDPLLSTGFPLALLGVVRLGRLLRSSWHSPALQSGLTDYSERTAHELETAARLIGALYATMDRFELFKELSLIYFAAASYSETVWRLGKPELAEGFLLCRHPAFASQLRQICERVNQRLAADEVQEFRRRIQKAIAPFDVAGLTDAARHPWYPAQSSDLFANASKVASSVAELRCMLQRCGWREGATGTEPVDLRTPRQ